MHVHGFPMFMFLVSSTSSFPVCTPKAMSDLRTRLQGWFVVMHEERKERKHQKFLNKQKKNKRPKRALADEKLGKVHSKSIVR